MRPYLPLLLAAALAACASGSEVVATRGPDARPSARALAAVSDSLADAPSRPAAVRRALIRAGATPMADFGRTSVPSPRFEWPGRVLGAYVPGRDPIARQDLVVLAAPLDGPEAAPVLEAVRVLVERSRWVSAPERSVQVMLWSGPAAPAPLWEAENVRALLIVGRGGDAFAAVPDSLAVETVAGGDAGLGLAERVLERVTALARRPPPPPPGSAAADTLAAP